MYKLVVIDDEYIVVEGIQAILERLDFDIAIAGSASDGISGLEIIRQEKPDIVISDIRIPGLDGLSLVEEAKEFLPDCQYIMVSGYTEFEYARRAMSLGVKAYIDKPITIDKVKQALGIAISDLEKQQAEHQQEKMLEIERKNYNSALGNMIRAINENDSDLLIKMCSDALQSLKNIGLTVLEYCQESFKLLCVIEGVYLEQQKQQAREIIVSYNDLEKINNCDDMDNYTLNAIKHIAGKIKAKQTGSSHRIIRQILEFIENNYHMDIGLTELADQTGMNPAYLSILFKEEVGMSYIKYLTELRIEKAKDLLISGCKVSEVSEKVGYANYRYFSGKFKQITGMTPGEYREGALSE